MCNFIQYLIDETTTIKIAYVFSIDKFSDVVVLTARRRVNFRDRARDRSVVIGDFIITCNTDQAVDGSSSQCLLFGNANQVSRPFKEIDPFMGSHDRFLDLP